MNRGPLNIALLSKALPGHQSGGLEKHTVCVALGLCRRGHRVTLFTSARPRTAPKDAWPEHQNLNLEFAPDGPPGVYSRAYFKFIATRLAAPATQNPFDLIHAQEFAALYLTRSAAPLITTIHGTLDSETPLAPHIFDRAGLLQRLKWRWQYKHRLLIRNRYAQLLNNSRHLLVDSEFTKNELLRDRVPPEKISVVPLGSELEELLPPAPEESRRVTQLDRPYVLTVSRLTWIKQLDLGIRALAAAGAAHNYVIIGDGPERGRLEREAQKYADKLKVHFLPNVSDRQLPCYYAGAALVLLPEISQPAFGLTALEANLMGVPVLAARTGALPEVVREHGGWLFERGAVEDCARRLERLLAGRDSLARAGIQARQAALRNFPLDRMIDGILQAYGFVRGSAGESS